MKNNFILTVSQLNNYLDRSFFSDSFLKNISVHGEIVNLNIKYSYIFLSLKDSNSSVDCCIQNAELIDNIEDLKEGADIIATGSVGIYKKSGRLRFSIISFELYGVGAYLRKIEKLKQKLSLEGLFDEERKKSLPLYPEKVGIITSSKGAAIRDIVNISNRRNPHVRLCLVPVKVQGDTASYEMTQAVEYLNTLPDVDVIIIGRGGGSMLDFDPFNTECLLRAIADSRIPVVSAVGHETDFTLCDLVSDLRASTPSAAAELVVPLVSDIEEHMRKTIDDILLSLSNKISVYEQSIKFSSYAFSDLYLSGKIHSYLAELTLFKTRFYDIVKERINSISASLSTNSARLLAMNPMDIFEAGYAVVEKNGRKVRSVDEVDTDDLISVSIKGGTITAKVTRKDKFSE